MNPAKLQSTAFEERDSKVTVAGVEVACRFTIPAGSARGAVLLVPGSLYSDVDGNFPSMNLRPHVYADLAEQLGECGLAVLRMAKIGPGTGSRTLDATAARRHTEFKTRAEVAAAGLDLLRRTVAARPVIVAGHSEGAVAVSLLAAGSACAQIDGVVSLSGPALPLLSILRVQVAGMSPPDIPADMTMFDATVSAIRNGDPLPPEAKSHPQTAMLASMPEAAIDYLRSVDAVDPVAALARVGKPVLIVQGGCDHSVPPAHADILCKARGSLPTEVAMFPGLTHMYKVAPADLSAMESMGLDTTNDPAVAQTIAAWAERLSQTPAVVS